MTDSRQHNVWAQTQSAPIPSRGRFPVYIHRGRSRGRSLARCQWTGGSGFPSNAASEGPAPDEAILRRLEEAFSNNKFTLNCRSEVRAGRPQL